MNNYTSVRAFLASVRECRVEKRRCEWRLEQLRSQCESITAVLRDTPGGGSGDKHKDELLTALVDAGTELADRMTAYAKQIEEVEDFIDRLPSAAHRVILRLRYVDLLRWTDVLDAMHDYGLYYEDAQMYRLHRQALGEAKKLWEADNEDSNSPEEDQ